MSRTDPTNKQLSHKEDFQVKTFLLIAITSATNDLDD